MDRQGERRIGQRRESGERGGEEWWVWWRKGIGIEER